MHSGITLVALVPLVLQYGFMSRRKCMEYRIPWKPYDSLSSECTHKAVTCINMYANLEKKSPEGIDEELSLILYCAYSGGGVGRT